MDIYCKDIAAFMEELAPVDLAEEWDNVGLLVGGLDREVRRILLCMDVTGEVVAEAAENKAEMIISHHPVIFRGMKRLTDDDFKGRILGDLIGHGISVYSAHTNLDVAADGVNDILANTLGLEGIANLKDYEPAGMKGQSHGLGRVGFLKEVKSLDRFVAVVKSALGVEYVRVIGEISGGGVRKVAVFCGSFDDDLGALKRHGADVLVTGDVKYHCALDAVQMGLCLIDAGHFATERIVLAPLAEKLRRRFPGLSVNCSRVEKDPFVTR